MQRFFANVVVLVFLRLVPISRQDVNIVIKRYNTWLTTRGPVWTADRTKLARLAVTRYICGTPLTGPAGLSLTKDGLPKVLPHSIRTLIREGHGRSISMAITLLSISRSILGGKPVDYNAITDGDSPWEFPIGFKNFIKEEIPFIVDPIRPSWSSFHWSTKAGPNGPALQFALIDYESLTPELRKDICTMQPELTERLEVLDRWKEHAVIWPVLSRAFKTSQIVSRKIRKLSVKMDREAKSRVFAILDYWSQAALYPLHLELFQILKRWSCDCTFNQGHGMTLRADPGHRYWSFDLTAATDRFPVEVQEWVLSQIIGSERAAAWRRIMVGHEFETPTGDLIRYGRGQPMGAHSSWPLFTFTHHLCVQYAANKVGLNPPFRGYRILGDDIVIAHDQVAEEYRKLMTALGVSISPTKTHVSIDTFEIAKRWYHKGAEVTPFPIWAFLETADKYHLFAELWSHTLLRGFEYLQVSASPVLRQMLTWANIVPSASSRKAQYLHGLIKAFLALGSLKSSLSDHDRWSLIKEFMSALNISIPCNWRETTALTLLENMASVVYYGKQETMASLAEERSRHYGHAILDEIEEQPGLEPSDQEELGIHWKEVLPMCGALTTQSKRSRHTLWDAIQASHQPSKFVWDKLAESKVLVIPVESGIIPMRSSHLKAGAKAAQVKDLRNELNKFLKERLIHVD